MALDTFDSGENLCGCHEGAAHPGSSQRKTIAPGQLVINGKLVDPNAPFGGYKAGGYGREHGAEALENCTRHKMTWVNLG